VRHFYDAETLRTFIAQALVDAPRGTQVSLAEFLDVSQPTVNKWANEQTCPVPRHWPKIEQFFGWEAGTLAALAHPAEDGTMGVEAAMNADPRLSPSARRLLLLLYRELRLPLTARLDDPEQPR
jgi:hypothetical protein